MAFKDGRPIRDTAFRTYNIKGDGQKLHLTEKAGPDEADLFVVRVAKGRIKVKAYLQAARTAGTEGTSKPRVTAPPTAKVATSIDVTWQGPAHDGDYITVARPDQAPAAYLGYTYVKNGNPLKLQMPPEPGKYEIRYIMYQGSKVLAKTQIVVK